MREQTRKQYSLITYLFAKILAELPIDAAFSTLFIIVLKYKTGLTCSLKRSCLVFSWLTFAGASLGLSIGSFTSSADTAMYAGMPFLVIFIVIGVINPSGVDSINQQPRFLKWLKLFSPIKWAIEALCIAEYRDMIFAKNRSFRRKFRDLPRMGALAMVQDGNQVLDALGLATSTFQNSLRPLIILTCCNLFITFVGLNLSQPQFIQARDTDTLIDDVSTSKISENLNRTQSKTEKASIKVLPIVRGF